MYSRPTRTGPQGPGCSTELSARAIVRPSRYSNNARLAVPVNGSRKAMRLSFTLARSNFSLLCLSDCVRRCALQRMRM